MEQNHGTDPRKLEDPQLLGEVLETFFEGFPENLEQMRAEQHERSHQAAETERRHATQDSVREFHEVSGRIDTPEELTDDQQRRDQLRSEIWKQASDTSKSQQ